MVAKVVVKLPVSLALQRSLAFGADLAEIPPALHYEFDCSEFKHAPPFGMLLAAGCLRQFRKQIRQANADATCSLKRASGNEYAAHMGFWRSFGADHGGSLGRPGGTQYIPIRQMNTQAIEDRARRKGVTTSIILNDEADELAEVLVQGQGEALEHTLSYALRELFRNVVDHSGASSMWYCAQYWPTKDRVELGILDEGRGISRSLRDNPDLNPGSEEEAIILATQPGISRVNPAKQDVPGMWPGYGGNRSENAGYGLYVLKLLAQNAGTIFILSNDTGVLFRTDGTIAYMTSFRGTAVRLVLKPSRLGNLLHTILETLGSGKQPSKLTASMLARLERR